MSWEPGEARMKVEGGQDCPGQPGSLPSVTGGEKPAEGFEGRACSPESSLFQESWRPQARSAWKQVRRHPEAGKS